MTVWCPWRTIFRREKCLALFVDAPAPLPILLKRRQIVSAYCEGCSGKILGTPIPSKEDGKPLCQDCANLEAKKLRRLSESPSMYAEVVRFRLFVMPCCSANICWVNPRLPNYCPECGQPVYSKLRESPEKCTWIDDPEALLKSSSMIRIRIKR